MLQSFATHNSISCAGGGFALGVFAGIGAFDDSINASKKITTTALIAAAGGAIGGYFLGRALDKRDTKTKVTWAPDELDRGLMRARWSAGQSIEMRDLKIAPVLNTGFLPFPGACRERVALESRLRGVTWR
jgi:hypothetical protein